MALNRSDDFISVIKFRTCACTLTSRADTLSSNTRKEGFSANARLYKCVALPPANQEGNGLQGQDAGSPVQKVRLPFLFVDFYFCKYHVLVKALQWHRQ